MTKEEAKKIGASHYMELGRWVDSNECLLAYYKMINKILFVFDCNKWIESEYTINHPQLKPL